MALAVVWYADLPLTGPEVALAFWCRLADILVSAMLVGYAVRLLRDWFRDNAVLRHYARQITKTCGSDSERIRAVSRWVYRNQEFAKNRKYFLCRAFGPAPIDVLRGGGDCADKSRLVAIMLNELGIKAGLVMLRPGPGQAFTHTCVEALREAGRIVVDPVWDVAYPLGVRELVGSSLSQEIVLALKADRGSDDKIATMSLHDAMFDHAVAVNWSRNAFTRLAARVLEGLGIDERAILRPRVLEDPKLLVFWLSLGCAGALLLLATLTL